MSLSLSALSMNSFEKILQDHKTCRTCTGWSCTLRMQPEWPRGAISSFSIMYPDVPLIVIVGWWARWTIMHWSTLVPLWRWSLMWPIISWIYVSVARSYWSVGWMTTIHLFPVNRSWKISSSSPTSWVPAFPSSPVSSSIWRTRILSLPFPTISLLPSISRRRVRVIAMVVLTIHQVTAPEKLPWKCSIVHCFRCTICTPHQIVEWFLWVSQSWVIA